LECAFSHMHSLTLTLIKRIFIMSFLGFNAGTKPSLPEVPDSRPNLGAPSGRPSKPSGGRTDFAGVTAGIDDIRVSNGSTAGRNAALPTSDQAHQIPEHLGPVSAPPAYGFDPHASGSSGAYPAAAAFTPPPPPPGTWTPGLWPPEGQPSAHHVDFAGAEPAPSFLDHHPGLAPIAATPTMEMHAAMQALKMTRKSFVKLKSVQASIEGLVDSMDQLNHSPYYIQQLRAAGIHDKGLASQSNQSGENTHSPMKMIEIEMEKLQAKLQKHPTESVLKDRIDKLEKLIEYHLNQALEQADIA
jgi:hypothetical protein